MNSLREEIGTYIYSCLNHGELWESIPIMTDDIIKIFEKRIDDLKQGYEKRYRGKSYISIKKSTLNEVKEMLK
jgi:hypothetical protein